MATAPSARPSLIPSFLALLVVIFFGYLLYSDLDPSRTEHTINPPIEIIDPPEQTPLTIITADEEAPNNEEITEQEAQVFVENLSPKTNKPITINEYNDQFVRPDSLIAIPELEYRSTTIEALLADKNLAANTPIILNFSSEEHSQTTLSDLARHIEDHTESITIITADEQKLTAPLADLLNRTDLNPDSEITLILEKKHHIKTHFVDLSTLEISPEQPLEAIISHGIQEISINEIIPTETQTSNTLFYLHRVTKNDVQGLWGIIQSGLIDKFRQGLLLEGISQNKDLIQAVIPADADEKLPSGLSSFLGKILSSKVNSSYIYNLKTKAIGFDANLIHPGQQLVLIHFSPEELKKIYQYFSDERNQETETFAITE